MDIEELFERCRTQQSKMLIEESIKCYRTGAYRASIVSSWLAVVHDLLSKIRELAVGGNGDAIALIKTFEEIYEAERREDPSALKRYLEFERKIIDNMKGKFDFFTQSESDDLLRLQQDRHRCAHPTVNEVDEVYRPPAELARLHLRNAVIHVLQRPAAQGSLALTALKAATESEFFPRDTASAERALTKGPLAHAREKTVRDFVWFLVDAFFRALSGQRPSPDQAAAAINATLRIHPEVAGGAIRAVVEHRLDKLGDGELFLVEAFGFLVHDSWRWIPPVAKIKTEDYIRRGNDQWINLAFRWASEIEVLDKIVEDRFMSLDMVSLISANSRLQHEYVLNRGINLLDKSNSFHESNPILRSITLPQMNIIRKIHVDSIVDLAQKNIEVEGAHGYQEFLHALPDALKPA